MCTLSPCTDLVMYLLVPVEKLRGRQAEVIILPDDVKHTLVIIEADEWILSVSSESLLWRLFRLDLQVLNILYYLLCVPGLFLNIGALPGTEGDFLEKGKEEPVQYST